MTEEEIIIGQTIQGYTIIEELGRGGYGTVYLGERNDSGGQYFAAIKHIMLPDGATYESVVREYNNDHDAAKAHFANLVDGIVSEINMLLDLGRKDSRHIVTYYDHSINKDADPLCYDIFIRMEYLTPLNKVIQLRGMSLRDVLNLGLHMCEALALCHSNEIMHRDIKEENIFVSDGGAYKLGDFGVAKTAIDTMQTGTLRGTDTYMAPEVYFGSYDKTVDIYSLGVILYRLLNNQRSPFMPDAPAPFTYDDKNNAEKRRRRGETPPLPCNAKPRLGEIVVKACSAREQRYSSVEEMKDDLLEYSKAASEAELDTVLVSPDEQAKTADYRTRKTQRLSSGNAGIGKQGKKSKLLIAALSGAAVVAIALIIFFATRNNADSISAPDGEIIAIVPPAPIAVPSPSPDPEPDTISIKGLPFLVTLEELDLDLGWNLADEDVDALRQMTNLTSLNLRGNQIRDISFLSDLANLTKLDLSDNAIADISALAGLGNLTELNLSNNEISNIIPLMSLPELSELGLADNQITDAAPLLVLKNLTALDMSANDISDISPLSGLASLTALKLENNRISDLSPLADLEILESLELGSNSISDITALSKMAMLTDLGLSGNEIGDVFPIANLRLLSELRLSHNQLADIVHLSEMVSLTHLYLNNNQIEDISPLSRMVNLTELSLNNNQIRDVRPLADMTGLTVLQLSNNQINDISPLTPLVHMTELSLFNNEIDNLFPLSVMTGLEMLFLGSNQISDISPLSRLTNLTELGLSSNQISDISALSGMTGLTVLHMNNTQISDISVLSLLTELTEANLIDNPINDWSPTEHIETVAGRPIADESE